MAVEIDELYRDHAARVWRYARARLPSDADAEDVSSEVFTRAMGSLHRFDPERGSEAAWITGVARNAVADFWRRRHPEDPAEHPPEPGHGEWDDEPGDRATSADESAAVLGHLDRVLTEREREAIALRFGAELSSPEIGAVLGTSPTAARMLVHRAVTKLRKVIEHG